MTSLKDQLIKIGSKTPALRPHIRPILAALQKGAGVRTASQYTQIAQHFSRTRTIEMLVGKFVRVRWTDGSVFIEELPVKGKKKLGYYHAEFQYLAHVMRLNAFHGANVHRDANVGKGDSFSAAVKKVEKAFEEAAKDSESVAATSARELVSNVGVSSGEEYFLNVAPGSSDPLTVAGKDFDLTCTWTSFKVASPDSDFQNHDPSYTMIVGKSPTAARKLYKILNVEPDALRRVSFNELGDWLTKAKIQWEYQFSSWR